MEIAKEIIQKKINEIKPYMRNARNNSQTVDLLVKIIPKVGFNVPIVIDEKGVIVKGHARYIAAIRLKMETVPCIISHASEEDVKLDRIADNVVSEFSEWITEDLLSELRDLSVDFDMSELSLPTFKEDVESLSEGLKTAQNGVLEDIPLPKEEKKGEKKPEEAYYIAICPRCGEKNVVKADL